MRTRLPSVVVIQERHIKYGERFKIVKVNNRRRREYVSKFLSAKKFTFRFKSKQVVIGRKTKELRYKGSPLAISRLLLLDGFKDPFPHFGQNSKTCESIGSEKREADSATSPTALNPPLSFFNLSDRRPTTTTSKRDSAEISVGSASTPNIAICPQVDLSCLPQRLSDFHLLFGSDTADSDEDSDAGEDELIMVEVDDTILSSQNNTDKKQQNAMNNTIKKIEKDVKHIAASLRDAMEAAAQKLQSHFLQLLLSPQPQHNRPSTTNISLNLATSRISEIR
ncbi:hypothetical protein WA026_006380 [Henosepilachna vigintioctopunctata]|uniref:Uncharacterized protein n=1 Tax=Henosepilachna vigintioctopunctata TaxID=420089 RepID=A0AAW1TKC7_9CUCU